MRTHFVPSTTSLSLALLVALSALPAVGEPPAPGAVTGFHIVRPGDTLRALSERFSGGEEKWPENWRLNPDLVDPDRIEVGQTLRLKLEQRVPANLARITNLSRAVEARPTPVPWEAAVMDSLLRDQDAVRTFPRSSAEMTFSDGSELKVTESSLVFLRKMGAKLKGVSKDEIEIVEGQADLGARLKEKQRSEIEILLGATRLAPAPDTKGELSTRARKAGSGAAQLMVYEGSGAVEAAGAKVQVARGMGTVVAPGAPPAPPEALLPAPALVSPVSQAALDLGNPPFSWQSVDGAVAYTLEICHDPACARLEQRALGLGPQGFRPDRLPVGDYYWRVTALAASGLDGYPSTTSPFRISSDRVDILPPSAALAMGQPSLWCGERLVSAARTPISARFDDAADVAKSTYLLDGKEIPAAELAGPWAGGAHSLSLRLEDRAGNAGMVGPFAWVADDQPPVITAEVGGIELLRRFGRPDRAREARERRDTKRAEEAGVAFEWSSDGALWLPLKWAGNAPVTVAYGDRSQLFFLAPVGDPLAASGSAKLGAGRLLRLSFADEACGVETVRFGIETEGSSAVLWVEATDMVGNAARKEWALSR